MYVSLSVNSTTKSLKSPISIPSSIPHIAPPNPPPASWEPPLDDYLKIHFDAAVCVSGCSFGLVIRGTDGHVVLAACVRHQGVVNPYLAELLAVIDVISNVASRSLTHVLVEGDSEVVVNQIRQGVLEVFFGGPVLWECHQINILFVSLYRV
ncbi:unnamed protein product [Linum trigynum]|uniref:RNase H type-1 domain-containing protein n=1 Tax=Linum trigynum TaxID=586398 RepID=A0AAV2FL07_9ROSI